MEQITITKAEYENLLQDRFFADAMRNFLVSKVEAKNSIFADEINLICNMYGIVGSKE